MTNHSSPTCVATFADGEVTRMTVWSANGKPDLRRGIHLAWAAHESRKRVAHLRKHRKQMGSTEPSEFPEKYEPPAITKLRFEAVDGDSVTTTEFTAEQIAEAIDDKQPESSASGDGRAEDRPDPSAVGGELPAEGRRLPLRSPRKRAVHRDQKTGDDR